MALLNIEPVHVLWIGLLFACCVVAREVFFSPLRQFPGPITAKFTNIRRAVAAARGHIDDTNRKWHAKYGNAVRVGPNVISLSDPSVIRSIYTTRNPWLKSDMYAVNDALVGKQRISNPFNTRDDGWHDQQVKPVRPFYSMARMLDIEPLIDETLEKLTGKLRSNYVGEQNAGKTCMIDDWMGWFAWDVTTNVSFGRHLGFIDNECDIDNLIKDSTASLYYFAPVCQIPWLDNWLDKNPIVRIGPNQTLTGVLYAYKVVAEYQQDSAEKGTLEKHVPNLLDKFIQLKDQYPEMVDDNQLVRWLTPNILAGGDSTAATMRAVVYYLAKHPDAYQRLVTELDEASLPLPAQWNDIKGLKYLDAVIRESMRLCPGVALMPERLVPEGGFTLPDGRFIPAGTKVGLNPGVTNRNAGVFGAAVDDFIPERWLKASDETEDGFSHRLRYMHEALDFIFGAGSRICLGRNLAKLEIYKLIATMYSSFDIKLVDPEHKWKYHNAWFIYQTDIPVIISRRGRT